LNGKTGVAGASDGTGILLAFRAGFCTCFLFAIIDKEV